MDCKQPKWTRVELTDDQHKQLESVFDQANKAYEMGMPGLILANARESDNIIHFIFVPSRYAEIIQKVIYIWEENAHKMPPGQ